MKPKKLKPHKKALTPGRSERECKIQTNTEPKDAANPPDSASVKSLAAALAGFGLTARWMNSAFILATSRGRFAIYRPRLALSIDGDLLRLGSLSEPAIFVRKAEITAIHPMSGQPAEPGQLFRRVSP
jgi:hypothetical protein